MMQRNSAGHAPIVRRSLKASVLQNRRHVSGRWRRLFRGTVVV